MGLAGTIAGEAAGRSVLHTDHASAVEAVVDAGEAALDGGGKKRAVGDGEEVVGDGPEVRDTASRSVYRDGWYVTASAEQPVKQQNLHRDD